MQFSKLIALVALIALVPAVTAAQQANDSAYTARIRELTPTDVKWKFTTDLVDHLPASATVPTPLKVLGYVPGTIGKLSYVADINRYFRALAESSPRVELFSLGMSDEGREMLLVAIADEDVIGKLDEYRTMLAKLADPRGLQAPEKARLVEQAKPIYWLTGSIHSPETGSPEMLMELAYRLAVEETDYVKTIRSNVITLITPVTEVDGRDRVVDAYKLSRELKLGPNGVSLIYWGKYTAHDNNRDGMVLSQKLTQNVMKGFLHWKPVVMHDLHESVPFLYTSTGTGPYNEEFDPIVVDEWHTLAYQEITELTRRGLPGIWTHGFYDGWAPNYMLAIANLHNSIGRFYETYTSSGADCHTVKLPATSTEKRWYRPNPPVNGVKWCIRSNINFQQSGVLVALKYVADHPRTFLENYVAKADRMIQRGRTSTPYAFVIPKDQRRAAEAAELVNLFRAHGTEIHVATQDFDVGGVGEPTVASLTPNSNKGTQGATSATQTQSDSNPVADATSDSAKRAGAATSDTSSIAKKKVIVHAGDWIVRLDQPYTQTARTLLARQKYKPDDPQPYDDTGWTLDELRHVLTLKIADSTVLSRPMTPLTADATVEGKIAGSGAVLVVKHLGDWRSAVLPWKAAPARVSVADTAFALEGVSYPPGTFIIEEGRAGHAREAVQSLGLQAVAVAAVQVRRRAIALPRIALMHSWLETQNEGWVRYAFDRMGVPYTYISDQLLKRPASLDRFDVVVFPHVSGSGSSLLNGRPMVGPAIPWKKSALTPNLGQWDETDDIRPGMGLEGAAALRRFVERGGLLIVSGNSVRLPVELGFNPTVSIPEARNLRARGAIYRAQTVAKGSPILYGYENATFPVYFNQQPLLSVQAKDTSGRLDAVDTAIVAAGERMRGKVILQYHTRADSLLISGLLVGGDEMAGKAAVVNAPVGKGHVLLFGIRPFWRWQSQGSFALALNAMANWNALGTRD
ncbi:MAG: M14 family zinc carboxypeptidase [Gemmatimonadaceae bacterium]